MADKQALQNSKEEGVHISSQGRVEVVTNSLDVRSSLQEPVNRALVHLGDSDRARYIELYLDAICASHSQVTINNLTKDTYEALHGLGFLGFSTRQKGSYNGFIREMSKYCIDEDKERIFHLRCRETQIENFKSGMNFSERYHQGYDAAGKLHWIRDRVMYIEDPLNGDILSIGMSDIVDTEMEKQMTQEIQLRQALEREESASRAKTDFLSSMSHDIRTPLNAILGFTHRALMQESLTEVRESVEHIDTAGKHLLMLVNDILDINKIESGSMRINETTFSAIKTCEKVTDITKPLAEKKHQNFSIDIHDISHEWICCDELRINQVALNLGRNAVAYTPEGGTVKIDVWQEPSQKEGFVKYCYTVSDNGIGMSEEFQQVMYQTFTRNTDSRVNEIQGSGLGLAICKRLTDLLGGTIECSSKLGEGTAFTVTVDVKIGEPPTEEVLAVASQELSGMHVLVAEDNDLNWKIAQLILAEHGITCDRVANGEECLQLLESANEGAYDAVLMDVRMPKMDGKAATRALRTSSKGWLGTLPVIAMTADAFAEDIRDCLNAGMNAHIPKPVDGDNLARVLYTVVHDA